MSCFDIKLVLHLNSSESRDTLIQFELRLLNTSITTRTTTICNYLCTGKENQLFGYYIDIFCAYINVCVCVFVIRETFIVGKWKRFVLFVHCCRTLDCIYLLNNFCRSLVLTQIAYEVNSIFFSFRYTALFQSELFNNWKCKRRRITNKNPKHQLKIYYLHEIHSHFHISCYFFSVCFVQTRCYIYCSLFLFLFSMCSM